MFAELENNIQSSSDRSRWLSTNPKPTIYRNVYVNTGPGDVFILDPVICIKKQSIDYNTITWGSYTENVQHLTVSCFLGSRTHWCLPSWRSWYLDPGASNQSARHFKPMLVQCWTTVCDAGLTLNQHRVNIWCLLGYCVNPLTAKLFNLNFHSLEVVSRWRDPQLQVSEKYSAKMEVKYCWLMSHFIFNMFKRWYLMC